MTTRQRRVTRTRAAVVSSPRSLSLFLCLAFFSAAPQSYATTTAFAPQRLSAVSATTSPASVVQISKTRSRRRRRRRTIAATVRNEEEEREDGISRRQVLTALVGTLIFQQTAAETLAAPLDTPDTRKIVQGYKRLNYLLEHWEAETTVCQTGMDNPYLGCDRSPIKVMEYLGYKSMDDPLFRADKTLIRLQSYVPADQEADYQEALDVFVEKAEEGSGMAYVSSWGEANPGGGKDRVALFIERSKRDVVQARDSLATVIRILNLQVE